MKYYNLTQGYINSSTHKGTYAIDTSGKDSGKDAIYAPFDCRVTKLYIKNGHAYTVWLTSLNKVLCANGKQEYLTLMIAHPEDIANLHIGQIFKQGQIVCHEGKTGNATGNHAHLELGIGTCGWHKNKYGIYTIDNPVKIEQYLALPNDCIVKNEIYKGNTYHLKRENEVSDIKNDYTVKYVTEDLNERKGPGTDYSIVNVLYKNTAVKVYQVTNRWARIEQGMWVSDKYLSIKRPVKHLKSMEVTSTDSLNVRATFNNGKIVGTIPKNCVVSVMENHNNWIKIGPNRWVYKKYLK